MKPVYYDGDASKIIAEPLILELIQDKKIIIRDNKILFHMMFNKGTSRVKTPTYTMGSSIYDDRLYIKAFDWSWLRIDQNGSMCIDYDIDVLEQMLKIDHGNNIKIVQSNGRVGYRLEGDAKEMTIEILEEVFTSAIQNHHSYVAVAVKNGIQHDAEIIINMPSNFVSKLDYYKKAYSNEEDKLVLNNCKTINIVGISSGNSLDVIMSELQNI